MTLEERQEASERRGLSLGEQRYLNRCAKAYAAGAATGAPPVRHFLEACVEWLAADLETLLDEVGDKPGPAPEWAEWTNKLGPDVIAFLALKSALNGYSRGNEGTPVKQSLTKVAYRLGTMLVDEARAQTFVEANSSAFANAVNHGSKTKLGRALRLQKRMKYHGIEIEKLMGQREAARVCMPLLMAMCNSTGAFEVLTEPQFSGKKWKRQTSLIATEATLQWITQRHDKLRMTLPLHPPTVIPPKDWAPGHSGGYHYALAGTLPLVLNTDSIGTGTSVMDRPMPLVYSALNALQRTPWRVNEKVHAIVVAALDGRLGGLVPGPSLEAIPPRPVGLERGDPVLTAWRVAASEAHGRNDRNRAKRADAQRAVVVASHLLQEEKFYYPYQLDFRGRAYPSCEFLNPHGPDIVRGMLEFADGVDLTNVGMGWLAVHGANCLGKHNGKALTRLNHQERVDVIRGLRSEIQQIAAEPLSNRMWIEADDPWQFLAFCFEWAEWLTSGRLVSHIPCGLDGTANGIQHYSALLRDPVGAAAVNMTNTDRPTDLYGQVADKVLARLRADMDPMARLWLATGLVGRSLVKRPVMTLAYGASRYGFVDQLLSTLREDDKQWQIVRRTFGVAHVRVRPGVQYLSAILWDVLGDTVGGALAAMDWLQTSACTVATATSGMVSWTVPMTGWAVSHSYMRQKRDQIRTRMNGTTLRPAVYSPSGKVDFQRTKNAIAPNVVHSLDAAAMMATTVACAARGVPAFSMIHDSYAVHSEYVPLLADCIRTGFIDLHYERAILDGLLAEWRVHAPDLPEPPASGNFDVREVRQARFFFN